MTKKPTIKILKRDERLQVAGASKAAAKKKATADPTRKMVETVSGWVRDFKQKSNAEATSLLETFFEKTPQPNET